MREDNRIELTTEECLDFHCTMETVDVVVHGDGAHLLSMFASALPNMFETVAVRIGDELGLKRACTMAIIADGVNRAFARVGSKCTVSCPDSVQAELDEIARIVDEDKNRGERDD